jgi:hypothetical protein
VEDPLSLEEKYGKLANVFFMNNRDPKLMLKSDPNPDPKLKLNPDPKKVLISDPQH